MAQRAQNRNESPSRRALTYGLTEAGRISSLAGMNGTVATTYADNLKYGAAGLLLRDRLADGGLTENRSYNWLGQMTLLDLVKTDSSHPLTLTWDYGSTGDNGNLLSHTTNTGTRTFTQFFGYDAASRLRMAVEKTTVSANLNSASTTCSSITEGTWPGGETCLRFGYDSFGNGWNEESRNASGLRFQGHNWYLIGSAVSNRIKDMEYDSAGNLRQLEPANPLSPVANYDGEGRIYEVGTRATSSPTATVTPTAQYYYNGDGQRVKRVAAGVTTYYVYGLDGAVAQEYTDGTVTATGRQYLIADHLGSTRLVLDGTTLQTVARYDYEPYGTLISRTGEGYSTVPGWSPFLFTGKERDMETAGSANPSGLDYFGARYFSAAQGRFTSPDLPANYLVSLPQSWNKYTYALNNPLSIVDPDGQFPKWVHDQIIDQISGLSPNDKAILKAASADADSFLKGGQSPSASFTHAMLDGLEFNSAQTDPTKAAQFVEKQLRKAIGIQAAYAANHRNQAPSFSPDALYAMGLAIHTVTDSASRFHNGASSYWYGGLSLMDYIHSAAEPLFYSMGGAKEKQEGVQRAEVTSRIIFQPSALDQVVNKIRQWFHLKQKTSDESDQQ